MSRRKSTEAIPIALLTRFAVKPDSELQVFSKAMESEVWRREDWLERRLSAFQKYTLPSILNQRDQDFYWFVGIDSSVSTWFKARLADVVGGRATIVEVPEGSSFNMVVSERLEPLGPHCITARLDSDDAVSCRFIGALRTTCKKVGHVYNFPVGLGLFEARGIVVRKWIRSNPFIASLSDPSAHVLTLGLHSAVKSMSQLHEVATWRPMYLKLYNGDMTSNFPQNGWATIANPSRQLRDLFGVTIPCADCAPQRLRVRFSLSWVGRRAGMRLPLVKKVWSFFKRITK